MTEPLTEKTPVQFGIKTLCVIIAAVAVASSAAGVRLHQDESAIATQKQELETTTRDQKMALELLHTAQKQEIDDLRSAQEKSLSAHAHLIHNTRGWVFAYKFPDDNWSKNWVQSHKWEDEE